MTDKDIADLMQPYIFNENRLSVEGDKLLFNGNAIGTAEIFHQTRAVRGGNGIEIGRLYIDDDYQKQGIGGALVDQLFVDNPHIDFIDSYPSPKSEPFWLRQGPKEMDSEGYFRITRESRAARKSPTRLLGQPFSIDNAVHQYRAIESTYFSADGAPKIGGMLAPNGQGSTLKKEQWIVVRTAAFKSWFGDWENNSAKASKVIDSNGEPLPVFHGSRAPYIDRFDLGMEGTGAVSAGDTKYGCAWFTSSEANAAFFADQRDNTEASLDNIIVYGEDEHFYAAIEDIEGNNLFQVGPFQTEESAQDAGVYAAKSYNSNSERGTCIFTVFLDIRSPLELSEKVPREKDFKQAKDAGCDGIAANDVVDGCEFGSAFVVFSAAQIKSALGNSQGFDCTTDNSNFRLPEQLSVDDERGQDTSAWRQSPC